MSQRRPTGRLTALDKLRHPQDPYTAIRSSCTPGADGHVATPVGLRAAAGVVAMPLSLLDAESPERNPPGRPTLTIRTKPAPLPELRTLRT